MRSRSLRNLLNRLLGPSPGAGGPVLGVIAISWLVVFGVRVIIPTFFPQIRAEFGVGNTIIGIAFTILMVANAIAQIPGGLLSDAYGERQVLVWSTLLSMIGLVAFAVTPLFAVFLLACGIFGFGAGLYGPPRSTILEKIYPENGATAQGITFAAGSLGAATLPYLADEMSLVFGWRSVFAVSLPFFAVIAGFLWVMLPREQEATVTSSLQVPRLTDMKGVLIRRPVLLAGSTFTMIEFIFQAFTSFLPLYLVLEKGLDQGIAAALYGLFFGVGIVVQPIAGRVADRYGYRVTLLLVTTILSVGLAMLPAVDGVPALALLVVFLRTGHAGIAPISMSYLISALPHSSQGSGFGTIRTIYLGIGSLGATFVGLFADMGFFDEAFLVLAGIAGVALLLYTALPPQETVS